MQSMASHRYCERADYDSGRTGRRPRRTRVAGGSAAKIDAGVSPSGTRTADLATLLGRLARFRSRAQGRRWPPGPCAGNFVSPRRRSAMSAVVDASVLVAVTTDAGKRGVWAEGVIAKGNFCAPHLVLVEATNVLRRLERSRELSRLEATAAQRDLLRLPLETVGRALSS